MWLGHARVLHLLCLGLRGRDRYQCAGGALLLKQRRAGERTSEVLGLHIPDCRDECSYRVRGIACVPVVRHIP
jgi:hypothetical protein